MPPREPVHREADDAAQAGPGIPVADGFSAAFLRSSALRFASSYAVLAASRIVALAWATVPAVCFRSIRGALRRSASRHSSDGHYHTSRLRSTLALGLRQCRF
jgi:hypothetical protein